MPQVPAPAPYSDADYEMIAAAVLETARGRWFLAEHAKRNRQADTRLVLDAIEKLERSIAGRSDGIEPDRVRVDLVEMMNAITRTKAEIAAIRPAPDNPSHFGHASSELDAIVDTTEKATSDILAAAERVQEIAWTLREQGVDASVCDLIDAHATEVYTACSFQDLTGQRIRKVIEVLRFIEERIETMIQIWRLDDLEFVPPGDRAHIAPAVRGEPGVGDSLRQAAVDQLMGNDRKQDIVWQESRIAESRDPRNLGEFDLEDLVVFDTAPDAPETVPTELNRYPARPRESGDPAPDSRLRGNERGVSSESESALAGNLDRPAHAPNTAAPTAPPAKPDEDKRTIEELTFTERMALFG